MIFHPVLAAKIMLKAMKKGLTLNYKSKINDHNSKCDDSVLSKLKSKVSYNVLVKLLFLYN